MLVLLSACIPALAGAQSATWPEFERALFVLNQSCRVPDHEQPSPRMATLLPPPTPLETRLRRLLEPALAAAMHSLQLRVVGCGEIPARRRWFTVEPAGDRFFELDVGVSEEETTSRGPSASVVVFVDSMQRRREYVSIDEPIRLTADDTAQRSELERAIRLAIIVALGEYRTRLSRPVLRAELQFDFSKLTPGERDFMIRDVLPFAVISFNPVARTRIAGSLFAVWFRPANDRPAAELMRRYAEILREDVPKTMDMYEGEPLHGYPVEVTQLGSNRLRIRVSPPAPSKN